VLIAFADRALGDDATALAAARDSVAARLGPAAMIDAAAVIAGFDGITRIADATGIPLEPRRSPICAPRSGSTGSSTRSRDAKRRPDRPGDTLTPRRAPRRLPDVERPE